MRAVATLLACFGALGLLLATSRFLAGRRWAAAGNASLALSALVAAGLLAPIDSNLATYDRPLLDRPIAQVYCERTGSHAYRLTLTRLPAGRMQSFELSGDEWRLAAHELAWRGILKDLGLRPRFRLERLSTRYLALAEPGEAPASDYDLGAADGLDIWGMVRGGGTWARFAAAGAITSPWQPLVHGGRYDVWQVRGGLDARPANEAAANATQNRPAAQER